MNIQENIDRNIIYDEKEKENNSYIEKPKNNEIFKNYENDLLVNLHKVNMRRNISQEETKQTQKSLDLDDETIQKFNTQPKRFFFPKNKNLFNENYDYNVND